MIYIYSYPALRLVSVVVFWRRILCIDETTFFLCVRALLYIFVIKICVARNCDYSEILYFCNSCNEDITIVSSTIFTFIRF